jgi:hypothetical protein
LDLLRRRALAGRDGDAEPVIEGALRNRRSVDGGDGVSGNGIAAARKCDRDHKKGAKRRKQAEDSVHDVLDASEDPRADAAIPRASRALHMC